MKLIFYFKDKKNALKMKYYNAVYSDAIGGGGSHSVDQIFEDSHLNMAGRNWLC